MLKSSSTNVFVYKSVFTYDSEDDAAKKYVSANQFKSAFGYTYQMVPAASDNGLTETVDDESWLSKISRYAIIGLSYIIVLALFPFSLWICVKKVNALERLVVLRLGKLQPVIGPGYCVVLPLIDNSNVVDLRPKTFSLPSQQVLTADGAIIEILATIKYCVCHAVHYVTKLHRQEQSVKDLVQRCLINLISEKEQAELENNRDSILSTIKVELNRTLVCWGLEITDVVLSSLKVLKEAESVNSFNQVFDALKTVATNCSNAAPFVMPVSPDIKRHIHREGVTHNSTWPQISAEGNTENDDDMVSKISKLMESARDRNLLHGISATYKLKILGEKKTILSISVNGDLVFVAECGDDFTSEDVTVALTEQDIEDFLSHKTSPIHAYLEGRILVTGDLSLLKHLAKVFE